MYKHERGSGILLHITSLPSEYGVGDLGKSAYSFCEFLAETGQCYWQVLPLNPTLPVFGNSPYSSNSAFAGNPLLVSPELMLEDGFLSESALDSVPDFDNSGVDYEKSLSFKIDLLDKSFDSMKQNLVNNEEFQKFCVENSYWLNDYALYCSLKDYFRDKSWDRFPPQIKECEEPHISDLEDVLSEPVLRLKFHQFVFFKQWRMLKKYCNERGVKIIGDLPFYVNHDSHDVWKNRSYFKLDSYGMPVFVSGVPPDYFSKTGQRWGNPVFNWEALRENGYDWWINRIRHNLGCFDILRLDHFRGFQACWEIPAAEDNAMNGNWADVPSDDFFSKVLSEFDVSGFIAEDLGEITDEVISLRDRFGFPGMNVLQFAFGDDYPGSSFLPENTVERSVTYTGTHDNNTTVGWWNDETTPQQRERVADYIQTEVDDSNINWIFNRLALDSPSFISIIPMQDILGLGSEARMNKPSTTAGNWKWRFENSMIVDKVKKRLGCITGNSSRKR